MCENGSQLLGLPNRATEMVSKPKNCLKLLTNNYGFYTEEYIIINQPGQYHTFAFFLNRSHYRDICLLVSEHNLDFANEAAILELE